MRCPLCGGELREGRVNHVVDIEGRTIIVKNVPALVCEQCGESYIEDEVAIKLEKIVNKLLENKTEITVANYWEIAA
ncbi:type II toxin-antitoxin system MqsA family antitoxin [Caldicellulosiruptor acetigenus]|uniref:type II toxin-antitoxin system MqsA family antitoxin n=1 Tax=Caldicellulosiruptor acetigenus TaxID=301953 RepID=UPI0003F897EA|nr:type II toxin-antitoxin system MqsA family antitoxin [Caldicellulosiruptor acetigenus]WAM37147.1 type II toxin-antitoxin system MqsA family antitoxin [Caldicellulosiruptor acetigenus]